MRKDTVRQIATIVAALVMIGVNALANALPINGLTTGEISDRYAVYFVPAGYVFSIWGLIYLGLIAFIIYQALPAQREEAGLRRVGWLFVISSAANVAWILLWHYELLYWTLPVMLVLLASLIAIYLRLGIGRSKVSAAYRWCVHVPFSIYLGWITVATVANASAVLYDLGWGGWGIGPIAWTVIMLIIATAIATLLNWTRRDLAYTLVIVWAFVGIAAKHGAVLAVALPALLLALLALLGWLWAWRRAKAAA